MNEKWFDEFDLSAYKILSKLPSHPLNQPCDEVLQIVRTKKMEKEAIIVAEIGCGVGATALATCRMLDTDDIYYCFDFEPRIEDLVDDLRKFPDIGCHIIGQPNSQKLWDSYNWNLGNLIFQMRKNDGFDGFDVAYLDGAHTFFHDGLAVALLKELLKESGYLILDDLFWSYAKSPTLSNSGFDKLTDEQRNDAQINRVAKLLLDHDRGFVCKKKTGGRAVYQKIMQR